MKAAIAMLVLLVACDDGGVDLDSLPTCANLGCPNIDTIDKHCAETDECFCALSRDSAPIQCAPGPLRCSEIGCDPPNTPGSSCADPSRELCSCPSPDGRPISLTCSGT